VKDFTIEVEQNLTVTVMNTTTNDEIEIIAVNANGDEIEVEVQIEETEIENVKVVDEEYNEYEVTAHELDGDTVTVTVERPNVADMVDEAIVTVKGYEFRVSPEHNYHRRNAELEFTIDSDEFHSQIGADELVAVVNEEGEEVPGVDLGYDHNSGKVVVTLPKIDPDGPSEDDLKMLHYLRSLAGGVRMGFGEVLKDEATTNLNNALSWLDEKLGEYSPVPPATLLQPTTEPTTATPVSYAPIVCGSRVRFIGDRVGATCSLTRDEWERMNMNFGVLIEGSKYVEGKLTYLVQRQSDGISVWVDRRNLIALIDGSFTQL